MSTSSSTKRKHVYSELLQPELRVPRENQQIVRLTGGRGNHLHDAETPEGDKFIVSMPTKFRKSVWVKRGDYVLVESIPEGDKVIFAPFLLVLQYCTLLIPGVLELFFYCRFILCPRGT